MSAKIFDIAKRRGIIYPSFEIYGGVAGFYDYGPIGVRIKKNIEDIIRRNYVIDEGCLEVECPTLSPQDVWVASGHVTSFTDVMTECVKCGEPYKLEQILVDVGAAAYGASIPELKDLLTEKNVVCPKCGGGFGKLYDYNLMFQTFIGPGKYKTTAYLRPETAQTTYLAFKRLWEAARKRLPFGVMQIGRSFRNEISPRQGILRLREFNQAEIQFFLDPEAKEAPKFAEVEETKIRIKDKKDTEHTLTIGQAHEKKIIEDKLIAYHIGKAVKVFKQMGITGEKLKLRQHHDDERSFYSSDTWDVEYESESFGTIELVGIADRTDYDLSAHAKISGVDFNVSVDGRKFVPHVLEVAYGIDRPFWCVLESCLRDDERGSYFSFPPHSAPFIACVFPLVSKDGLEEKAREVFDELKKKGFFVFFDKSGSIGRRYTRADEVGVPFCLTVDYDTLKDESVTIRERDSKGQERVKLSELVGRLRVLE
ncbi:MAG: glycine--tRNA ligase [Candidatus Altiarchaeota archaeon]